MNYFLSCITTNYVGFSGRARRAEYWYYTLFVIIISIAANLISIAITKPGDVGVLSIVVALALFLPGIAVGVRRLHDTGRSGWWMLIPLLPIIGSIILLVFFVFRGDESDNEYGPDPIGGGAYDEVFK